MSPQWTSEIRQRLAVLDLAPTHEATIVEELAQYLDDCYAELLASGTMEAEAITGHLPDVIPRLQQADVDAPVLVFTPAVSLLTGLLFGLVPALQVSHLNPNEGLKEGERGSSGRRQRLHRVLAVGESP